MKNIIFLVLFLNSFAFSYDSPNPATDKLTLTGTTANTCLASIDHPINTYFYQDANHATCLKYTSTIYTSTLCPDGKKYNKYFYSVDLNYPSCPSGQEIINGACAVPPTCATGTTWNPLTDTCQTNDSDGDGIPDKCDINSADIATLDCDGDGLANNGDGDMDGDGVPNSSDANPLDSANTASCPVIPSGYQLSISVTDASSCNLSNSLFTTSDGDLFYTKYANWDSCRNKCYFVQTSCPKGQAIKNGECRSVEPDISDCAGTSSCRIIGLGVGDLQSCFKTCNCLTTSSPTPTTENNYFYEEVSCADNQTDDEKLDDLRDKSDINTSVNKLDINGSVNNDTAASFKAALDSYAGAKESTSLNQLKELSIQSLEAVKTNSILDNLKSLAENFFNTSTSNDGVIDGTLHGIKDNTAIANNLSTESNNLSTESNSLLSDIKDLLLGDSNSTTAAYSETAEQGADRASIDGKLTDASNFLSSITADFDNLKNNLQNGITPASISAGSSPSFTANVFGRNIDFDLCSTFSRFASMFYYVFVLIFMFITIRIFYSSFKIGI